MGFLLFSGTMSAPPSLVSAPSFSALPTHAVTLTAYNAVPEQTDSTPFETSSGAYSNPEVVAARSRDLAGDLPFGTIIEIIGPSSDIKNTCGYNIVAPIIGYRVIADTMNARYTSRIDILFDIESNYLVANGKVKNAGVILGICNGASIRVVGHVDIKRIPKTQAELAFIVNGKKELAIK